MIKTKTKLEDLSYSILSSAETINELKELFKINEDSLNDLEGRLKEIKPQILDLKSFLSELFETEKVKNQIEFFYDEIKNLYTERDALEKLKLEKDSTDIHNVCDYDILKNLSEYIQSRLSKWEYNDNPKVVFNSEFRTFDVVISNKGRGSFGKGRRAISYAACLFGFLDYCLSENKKFSNLIIIDSPLTTFKDNEKAEEEHESIDDKFFENLSETDSNSQIIIFENKVPSAHSSLNVIEFTRNKEYGRYGFYPQNE